MRLQQLKFDIFDRKLLNKTEKSFSNLAARNGEIFNFTFVQRLLKIYIW
jgi:hypothetical protein